MRESQIMKACLDLLEAMRLQGKRVYASRTNAGKIQDVSGRWVVLAREGWPDITAVIDGRFVGIETKSTNGKLRESQKKAKDFIERAGGVYLVVNELSVLRNFLGIEGKGKACPRER